jgi:hypothetical protein
MVWEAIFLLVILKIPIVYLCGVVWWAIKAEPTNEPPSEPVPVADTPSPEPPRYDPRPSRRRPAPGRTPRRPAGSRPGGRLEVRR